MNTVLHKAQDRGRGDFGWLTTRYSFSFANWYDPSRTGFGKLIVINDDRISAGQGFGMHQHNDMEIITIVMSGILTHKDSLGNVGTVRKAEVQIMSAGTGVAHSEYNASTDESLELFQIWILPKKLGISPRYKQAHIPVHSSDGLSQLVGPEDTKEGLGINQDAYIFLARVTSKNQLIYNTHKKGNGIYLLVISGTVEVASEILYARDAIGITDTESIKIVAHEESEYLIIEVPMDSYYLSM